MRFRLLVTCWLAAGLAVALVASGTGGALAGPVAPVQNVTPPEVSGDPAYGSRLDADPGTWTPADATYTYQWLRDGEPIDDAVGPHYRPRLRDIDHQVAVLVTASADGFTDGQTASSAVRITRGTLTATSRPRVSGSPRFDHTLVAHPATWSSKPDRVRYQWLRDGQVVKGAHGMRLRLGLAEFGSRISVRATGVKKGYRSAQAMSAQTEKVGHRVPVRHVVRYHVETRGHIVADLGQFKQQVQQTYDDPRGWRGSGIELRRVASGGSITVVLAEASQVPTFSSGCSAQWSCRVGRFVIINQLRWRTASPMWHQRHRSLRDYRHMVVNHETGHWLGWGHRSCPAAGALAPVMQQQSKGLDGCRPNPWPTVAERNVPRY